MEIAENQCWNLTSEVNIPVDLIFWVLREEPIKLSVLKTFICLKLDWPDRFLLTTDVYLQLTEKLNINYKTAKQHIDILRNIGCLGYSKKTNRIFIRTKNSITPKAERRTKYQVRVTLKDLEHFTEFSFATIVSYIIKKKKNIARFRPALENEDALQGCDPAILRRHSGYPISVTFIANAIGKSKTWVDVQKKRAIKLGLMKPITG